MAALAISADDTFLALGGDEIRATIWNLATNKRDNRVGFTDPINCLALTKDGRFLVVGGGKMINTGANIIFPEPGHFLIWDLTSMAARYDSKIDPTSVTALALSSDGNLLAVGFFDGNIKIIDVATLETLSTLKPNKDQINWLSFLAGGKQLASHSSRDEKVIIWDVNSRLPLLNINNINHSFFYAATISPDEQFLVTGDGNNNIRFWSTETGNYLFQVKTRSCFSGKAFPAYCLAFSPDGKILVAGLGEGTLLFWGLS